MQLRLSFKAFEMGEAEEPLGLRITVLHGFLQTGAHMKMKTGQLRKTAPKNAYFAYPDAPMRISADDGEIVGTTTGGHEYRVPSAELAPNGAEPRFGYMLWQGDVCYGLEEAIAWVLSETEGSDCVIAFSQAASICLAALLLENSAEAAEKLFSKKLVLVAPFFPYNGVLNRARLCCPQSKHPNVVVMQGLGDQVVGTEGYKALREMCPDFSYVEHEEGHFIPCSGRMKEWWRYFFSQK